MSALQPAKPRSRRLLVMWSVALGVLIITAVLCWAVVVPVWRVRSILERYEPDFGFHSFPEVGDAMPFIEELGGPEEAATTLGSFLRLPTWVVGDADSAESEYRFRAFTLLGFSGRPGVSELTGFLSHPETETRRMALLALALAGPSAKDALPAARALQQDKDPEVQEAARSVILLIETGGIRPSSDEGKAK